MGSCSRDLVRCLPQEKLHEASDVLKEQATKAAKVGSEYAEVFGEKAASAAEAGNEYLAHGAEIVKEYATYGPRPY